MKGTSNERKTLIKAMKTIFFNVMTTKKVFNTCADEIIVLQQRKLF